MDKNRNFSVSVFNITAQAIILPRIILTWVTPQKILALKYSTLPWPENFDFLDKMSESKGNFLIAWLFRKSRHHVLLMRSLFIIPAAYHWVYSWNQSHACNLDRYFSCVKAFSLPFPKLDYIRCVGNGKIERFSYEWEAIRQIRNRTISVPYVIVTVMHCALYFMNH